MKRPVSSRAPVDFYDYLLRKNYSEQEVIEWRAVPPGIYVNLPPKEKLPRFSLDLGKGAEEVLYAPTKIQRQFHGSTVPNCILEGPRGTGKAVAPGTPIPTPRGWVTMQDIRVGDEVFGSDGRPVHVVWKSPSHIDPTGTFRVSFDDGTSVVCGGQHEWLTQTKSEASRNGASIKTTLQIRNTLRIQSGRESNHRIPLSSAWDLPQKNLPIAPYVLGAWLGDGSKGSPHISSADPQILDEIRREGYEVVKVPSAKYAWSIRGLTSQLRQMGAAHIRVWDGGRTQVCGECGETRYIAARGLCDRCWNTPTVRSQHRKSHKGFKRFTGGVLTRKRIPEEYLFASTPQRLALLQGLMDTDGTCCKRQGSCEFTNTNEELARGVYQLAASLGLKPHWSEGRATLRGWDCGPKFRVLWTSSYPVFRLSRKRALLPTTLRSTQTQRYVVNVEPVGDQYLQCIQVESPDHLYQIGHNCITTHNSLAIRWDAHMRALAVPGFTYLILRREMRDLRMSHLKFVDYEMSRLNPTHKNPYNKTDNIAYYPNGSTGFFSYCVHLQDVMHLLSSDFGAIYFDEITTFPWEMISKISASARVPEDSGLTAFVKGGTNPLGVGAHDVKLHFITKRVPSDPDYNPDQWEAIRTTRQDNPYLDWSQYDRRLSSLSDRTKRAWRDGEWVNEGAYFTEFSPTRDGRPWHVIEHLPTFRGETSILGQSWIRIYRSLDWGFRPDPAVCIWYLVFPNGLAIAFKERKWLETIAEDVAKDIKRESKGMHIVDTFADPSIFAKRGESLFSIGDIIENNGVPLTPSVNDRVRFGSAICNYLNATITEEVDSDDGMKREFRTYPRLQILRDGCPDLIRTLPDVQADPTMPSRMADGGEDHWVVSLAYFCMGDTPPPRDPDRPTTPRWMLSKRAFNRSFGAGLG